MQVCAEVAAGTGAMDHGTKSEAPVVTMNDSGTNVSRPYIKMSPTKVAAKETMEPLRRIKNSWGRRAA